MDYVITNSHMLYINLYFDGKRTLDQVPPKLKDVVEKEVTTNKQNYVTAWVAKVRNQGFTIENVPVQLRADVQNELQMQAKDEERASYLYTSKILDEKITINDVPESIREVVRQEVEYAMGKKLD